jgi:hypothetical protein
MFSIYVGVMYRESLYNINNDIKVHKYDKHTHAYTRKDMATLNLTYLIKKTLN